MWCRFQSVLRWKGTIKLSESNFQWYSSVDQTLTLKIRGLSHPILTRSISWLLMPWLLASPSHQQPWYWLCKLGRSVSAMRKDFNYLCYISVEECKYMFIFLLKNLACKELKDSSATIKNINPSGADSGIFQDSKIRTLVTDNLMIHRVHGWCQGIIWTSY